jgi:hypothetical protein
VGIGNFRSRFGGLQRDSDPKPARQGNLTAVSEPISIWHLRAETMLDTPTACLPHHPMSTTRFSRRFPFYMRCHTMTLFYRIVYVFIVIDSRYILKCKNATGDTIQGAKPKL